MLRRARAAPLTADSRRTPTASAARRRAHEVEVDGGHGDQRRARIDEAHVPPPLMPRVSSATLAMITSCAALSPAGF
jgi:hypothetical protein